MDNRLDISKHSKDKRARGLLRGVVVSGLVSGLAAASLGWVPTANATCLGIFGIDIGGGCTSNLFTFALGLGPDTTATADGLFTAAVALGTGSEATSGGLATVAYAGFANSQASAFGTLGLAASQGTNVISKAGDPDIPSIGNLALNLFASNDDTTGEFVNSVSAVGFGNIAVNLFGNKTATTGDPPIENPVLRNNTVDAIGTANFALSGGDDNQILAEGMPFGAAFNVLGGSRNTVTSTGSFPFAGTIGVNDQVVAQNNFGIKIVTPFNAGLPMPPAGGNVVGATTVATGNNTNGVAAGGTQGNRVRPGLNAAFNRPKATSPGASVLKSVSDRITTSTKKFRDTVSRGISGLARDAKAGADSTSSSDK